MLLKRLPVRRAPALILGLLLAVLSLTSPVSLQGAVQGDAKGGGATDNKADASATTHPLLDNEPLRKLTAAIEGLTALLDGRLPEGQTIETLVGLDLKSPKDVKARVRELKRKLAKSPPPSRVRDKESAAEDQARPDRDAELAAAERQRDGLLLKFLQLPVKKHAELLEVEEQLRRTRIAARVVGLDAEITALQELVDGKLPDGFEIKDLFEVALDDPEKVRARVDLLRATIESDAKRKKAEARKGGGAPRDKSIDEELAERQMQRDQLRLTFLEQPEERRQDLLKTEAKQKRIAQEQAASKKALAEATKAQKEAEDARQEALEQARQAETEMQQKLAAERARLEQANAAVAAFQGHLAAKRQQSADKSKQSLELLNSFRTRLGDPAFDAPAADLLYDEIVQVLTAHRRGLDDALRQLDAPSLTPSYKPEIDLEQPPYSAAGAYRDELLRGIGQFREDAQRLRSEEHAARWASATEQATDVQLCNSLRLALIPRLSPAKRSSVLGLTREGVAQAFREIDQVRLITAFFLKQRLADKDRLRDKLTDMFALGRLFVTLIKLLVLLLAAVLLRRRNLSIAQHAQAAILHSGLPPGLRMFLDRWILFFGAIGVDAGRVLLVYAVFWILGAASVPELSIARTLLLAYAWYRLSLMVSYYLITRAAASRHFKMSEVTSDRALRSIRLVARYVFLVLVFLDLSVRVLGRGYLYRVVVNFSWIGAFPIVLALMFRWRADIKAAYLRNFPQGAIADRMRKRDGDRIHFHLVALATALLATRWSKRYFGDLLVRFEHSRRAVAFLFRRRLEKHAQNVGGAAARPLPTEVLSVFSEGPAAPELVVPHFPQLELARGFINDVLAGKEGGAIALVGETGVGKTTWLNELAQGIPAERLVRGEIDADAHTAAQVHDLLANLLGCSSGRDAAALAAEALSGPPKVVLLDQCQNLVLRAVGGMLGFEAFLNILNRTGTRLLWVCAFSRYAWEYVDRVASTRTVFNEILWLKPWKEEQIEALIATRMRTAGFESSYQDMIIDRLEGTDFDNEVVRTGERYRQLLSDYADGLPRVAIHFWLKSLSPGEGKTLDVHLFKDPSADELESLPEIARFLLGAVVAHENLTPADAARVLNYPRRHCDYALKRLCREGILEERAGRHKVTSHWNRAVVRFLRRKHLLYS